MMRVLHYRQRFFFVASYLVVIILLLVVVVPFVSTQYTSTSTSEDDDEAVVQSSVNDGSPSDGGEGEEGEDDSLLQPEGQRACHAWTGATCGWEPSLQKMTVDFGAGTADHQETFYAHVPADVSLCYNETEGYLRPVKPASKTLFGKFINLGPDTVRVYWKSPGQPPLYMADLEPFGSSGTATYPGHVFVVTPMHDANIVLTKWKIKADRSLYYYDPLGPPERAVKRLSPEQLKLYRMQWQNKVFAERYREFTGGNDWLALYKHKHPPRFHMWRADAFGQTHAIETKEIHFTSLPPDDELRRGTSVYGPRPDERSRMRQYRDVYPTLNLTLTVLSCSPRVFEIENFLSDVEVEHILNIAARSKLDKSSTRASANSESSQSDSTRSSTNGWVARKTDLVTDAIYRRSADVLRMNEALLRWRRKSEIPEFHESMTSVAEELQLVHYDVGQQYTPHHDFSMPGMVHLQPSRFATMLFYLNDSGDGLLGGGETAFPRWLNAETSQALEVTPKKGKAILFYNLLPDGNYDERSLHAALPVKEGEKYLANLWVWDPMMDHTVTGHV